jgi:hypothetical protein
MRNLTIKRIPKIFGRIESDSWLDLISLWYSFEQSQQEILDAFHRKS